MTAKDDRKNAEGYSDPTAYNAIKNVEQEQEVVKELHEACVVISEAWSKFVVSFQKFAEALSIACGNIYKEEEKRKIYTIWKCKSRRHFPDFTRSTYTYKPVGKRNLPYQRRNF